MKSLITNANAYAQQMVADYGIEGAKEIAKEARLNRCPECKIERTDSDYIADYCPNCGDLGLPF